MARRMLGCAGVRTGIHKSHRNLNTHAMIRMSRTITITEGMTMATTMVPSLEDGVCSVSLDMSKLKTGSWTEKTSCYLQPIRQMGCVDAQLRVDRGRPRVVTTVSFASHHYHIPQWSAHDMLCRMRSVSIGLAKIRRKRSHAVRGPSFFSYCCGMRGRGFSRTWQQRLSLSTNTCKP